MEDVTGRRIAAALIDVGIVLVIVGLVGGIFGNETAADAPASARFGALDRILAICLVFGYYWIAEAVWAQTVGKRVMKIRVVRIDGSKAAAGATFVRTLLRAIDGLFFYLVGLITIFATGERRARLGDLAAKTKVVADDASPPPPPSERRDRPEDDDILAQVLR
ncbi:MAG TPA: RDD family protein [Solirubrobacteraceae bacterium]|nr:RDD family protein [Solirubrobacteraceae bacterium]